MRIPSYITPEAAEIIEREYPTCLDSAALAQRLGITVPQLYMAVRRLHCYKADNIRSTIQRQVTSGQGTIFLLRAKKGQS